MFYSISVGGAGNYTYDSAGGHRCSSLSCFIEVNTGNSRISVVLYEDCYTRGRQQHIEFGHHSKHVKNDWK